MPEPHQPEYSKGGLPFFANDGAGFGLPELGRGALADIEQDQTELKYGEHVVSFESFKFLQALEPELGKEWLEDNLGTGIEKIRLNKKGDIFHLDCSHTRITTLPELPAGLTWLYCFSTKITTLPELPAGLKHLRCANTQITALPELPPTLEKLFCGETPIAYNRKRRTELEAECREKGIKLYT